MPIYGLALVAVVPAALLALLALLLHLAWQRTSIARVPLGERPSAYGLRFEGVSFPAQRERLLLRGWYLPAGEDDRCIVLVQGEEHHRNSPGIQALRLGRDLVGRGYSVLMFDFRGRGESEGRRATAGDRERRDLLGALRYVQTRGIPLERTGVLGFSLGAAVALLGAAQEPRLRAVVCDSAFADLLEELRRELVPGIVLPRFAVGLLSAVASIALGANFGAVRPILAVPRLAPRPVLFIHGTADTVADPRDSERMAALAAGRGELWLVEGAGHVQAYARRPREYAERVAAFFDRHLNPQ